MIECTNCESSQFVQIVKSSLAFDDSHTVTKCHEETYCTLCKGEGTYDYRQSSGHAAENVEGDIRVTGDKPLGVIGELHQL